MFGQNYQVIVPHILSRGQEKTQENKGNKEEVKYVLSLLL